MCVVSHLFVGVDRVALSDRFVVFGPTFSGLWAVEDCLGSGVPSNSLLFAVEVKALIQILASNSKMQQLGQFSGNAKR